MSPSRRLRVALIAEESAGLQVLRALAATEHEVVAVVASESARAGLSGVFDVAGTMGVPRVPAALMAGADFPDRVRGWASDLILNVHSLFLLPGAVLELPSLGAYNLHPGPLPEMAGLNVPSWAILEGRREHGVTVHRMEVGIDSGAIAYQERFEIDTEETGLSLMSRCARKGVQLVQRLVEDAASGRAIPALVQDRTLRRYYRREVPDHGWVDWRWPAARIVAFVRACDYGPFPSPWGRPRTVAGGDEITIARASVVTFPNAAEPGTVVSVDSDEATVATGEGFVRMRSLPPQRRLHPGVVLVAGGGSSRMAWSGIGG